MVGGPDSGKTNFLARLVAHLRDGDGKLRAPDLPDDIQYVEEALAYLMKGEFAPRSHNTTDELSGDITLDVREVDTGATATISVPDVSGETWDEVARTAEISRQWLDRVQHADGALLFVRVLSELNVTPLDWVNTAPLLELAGPNPAYAIPSQVLLCQLLRLLQENLGTGLDTRPRVGIVVTAYDLLDTETRSKGPLSFLRDTYPLFAGMIDNVDDVEIGVFGASVVGGELADVAFQNVYLEGDIVESGYVVDDTLIPMEQVGDISRPVSWVLQFQNST
nr:hypothetical protein [Sphingorhabdus profundilacus]